MGWKGGGTTTAWVLSAKRARTHTGVTFSPGVEEEEKFGRGEGDWASLFAKPKFRRNRNSSEISSEKFFRVSWWNFGGRVRNFGPKFRPKNFLRTEIFRFEFRGGSWGAATTS